MAAQPVLPTHFPCWVKAVYSWGGETKRDLGFMEGDLIECLNAGDGMWWMGRLRRDRRMVGLFPSNFVKILDGSFQPAPNRSSPASSVGPSRTSTPPTETSTTASANHSPQRALFRRPFQSYTSSGSVSLPGSATKSRESQSPSSSVNKRHMPKPFSSMKEMDVQSSPPPVVASRPPSPTIPAPIPRGGSSRSRFDCDAPSRAASPAPNTMPFQEPLASFPQNDNDSSPPPPPPPAHRVAYNTPTKIFHNDRDQFDQRALSETSRGPSPVPSSHTGGMTPSPLRQAMDDVMSSLEGMSVARPEEVDPQETTIEPANMWSPEAFDELYRNSTQKSRPHTSIGVERNQERYQDEDSYDFQNPTQEAYHQFAESQHTSYVQRMESRLRRMQQEDSMHNKFARHEETSPSPPPLPPKGSPHMPRSFSSLAESRPNTFSEGSSGGLVERGPQPQASKVLKTRKSAYELGKAALGRTFTVKSNGTTTSSTANSSSTNNSNSTQLTSESLMSGHSASGFSATSAGSLARRKFNGSTSIKERPMSVAEIQRPQTAASGFSFQSNDDLEPSRTGLSSSMHSDQVENYGVFGGLATPAAKKRGFLTKVIDSVKTGAATARTNMAPGQSSRPQSPIKNRMPQAVSSGRRNGVQGNDIAKDMGLGGNGDWVQMRRDVNRSNSLSRIERTDRVERCQMNDMPVLTPVDVLYDVAQGDEASDGSVVTNPTDFSTCNLALVEKSARFVNNLPMVINSTSLAQTYLCRPYRSDVQKLRAIFTWVTERITWEEDFDGEVDTRRVIQTRRGCPQEIATLVSEMCLGVGIHAETVRGRLKLPSEAISPRDLVDEAAKPNHWWNVVIADGEWRIMDCSLASPKHPNRSAYTSMTSSYAADSWWFLTRPMEICYTHVPLLPRDQHIVPTLPHEVLMALPVASPAFFKNQLQLWDFDTSLVYLDSLEMAHIQLSVPDGVECTAEVEARAFIKDSDGDLFESGEVIKKGALAQGEYITVNNDSINTGNKVLAPFKRYTIKAVLPSGDTSNIATLKIYAGKRGLQHSISSNPHSIALSLPLTHTGPNPSYEFFTKHPTPHALRHELYVTGPLCKRLVYNSTFVFGVRQHPSRTGMREDKDANGGRARSPVPSRPGSALSMNSISVSGSTASNTASNSSCESNSEASSLSQEKPAKLAIQSPSGKILRMTRKIEQPGRRAREANEEDGVIKMGSHWETIIKIGERGTWRGLVLADRSARWCVFGEWECA